MIRNNLATQPFYNEGAVRIWLLILAAVVAIATVANVTAVLRYSRSDTELATQASRDEERAVEVRRAAAKLRESVDAREIAAAAGQAKRANDLIDRRTFSWTELLNRLEKTLPGDVRLTAVVPSQNRDEGIALSITVVARGVDDINEFIENLEATGTFADVLATEERVDEDGQIEAALQASYLSKPSPAGPAIGEARPQ
jgi:Tfp pilus assembly protein PilN